MVTILTYRDEYFPGPIDKHLWKQVIGNFKVGSFNFIGEDTEVLPEVIVFDEFGETPLADFVHPEEATYLFGNTGMRNLLEKHPQNPSVRIEVGLLLPNQGMFASQAAAIVLYDRQVKTWR